jgi:hypothetical protein
VIAPGALIGSEPAGKARDDDGDACDDETGHCRAADDTLLLIPDGQHRFQHGHSTVASDVNVMFRQTV